MRNETIMELRTSKWIALEPRSKDLTLRLELKILISSYYLDVVDLTRSVRHLVLGGRYNIYLNHQKIYEKPTQIVASFNAHKVKRLILNRHQNSNTKFSTFYSYHGVAFLRFLLVFQFLLLFCLVCLNKIVKEPVS